MQIFYTTFPDAQTAKKLIHGLLEKRLIACGNILSQVTSIYEYKDEVHEDPEVVALLKTTESQFSKIQDFFDKNHPYETYCLLAFSVDQGAPDFVSWVQEYVKN